jgi:hypothetical protein
MKEIIMPDIKLPPGDPNGDDMVGEFMFMKLAINRAHQADPNNKDITNLVNNLNDGKIQVYLTHMGDNGYELVAMNKDGKRQCFNVACEADLTVKSITSIKPEQLSKESLDCCEQINNYKPQSPEATNGSPTMKR